ncbi:MAG: PilZ domain-containing protein [bacterium]|nr:PilZ domain-containing protein [bacterium]
MQRERAVLVLGDHGALLGDLAERVRKLGHRTVRLKTLEEAIDFSYERNVEYATAFIEPEGLAYNLHDALRALRLHSSSPDLCFIATGPEPEEDSRVQLREAGVERALWTPVADNVLRFQLNGALSCSYQEYLRCETRAPITAQATVSVGGRRKRVDIYSLSAGGAFLETPRPSMSGAQVEVAFLTPEGELTFDARVLYTNVPGNLSQPMLPMGMAVRFDDVGRAASDAICEVVKAQSKVLAV